jgi:hypothetical protein
MNPIAGVQPVGSHALIGSNSLGRASAARYW